MTCTKTATAISGCSPLPRSSVWSNTTGKPSGSPNIRSAPARRCWTAADLLADGPDGFWVASSLGLSYFDRRTERFARLYQHSRTEPDSLSDNSVVSLYRDRSGLVWVGTANGGVNILDLRQRQFSHYTHRPEEPDSLSPGKVSAIHEDSNGVLWVGSFPRALDRLDRKSGRIAQYVPGADGSQQGQRSQ